MDLQQLELHDAQLQSVYLDPIARTVDVRLAYYPNETAKTRVLGTLRFTGVSQFNQIADIDQLQSHFRAGNVGYWVCGEVPGVSYIYLARGLIAITSASVELLP
jgi:hypothetical protein